MKSIVVTALVTFTFTTGGTEIVRAGDPIVGLGVLDTL